MNCSFVSILCNFLTVFVGRWKQSRLGFCSPSYYPVLMERACFAPCWLLNNTGTKQPEDSADALTLCLCQLSHTSHQRLLGSSTEPNFLPIHTTGYFYSKTKQKNCQRKQLNWASCNGSGLNKHNPVFSNAARWCSTQQWHAWLDVHPSTRPHHSLERCIIEQRLASWT